MVHSLPPIFHGSNGVNSCFDVEQEIASFLPGDALVAFAGTCKSAFNVSAESLEIRGKYAALNIFDSRSYWKAFHVRITKEFDPNYVPIEFARKVLQSLQEPDPLERIQLTGPYYYPDQVVQQVWRGPYYVPVAGLENMFTGPYYYPDQQVQTILRGPSYCCTCKKVEDTKITLSVVPTEITLPDGSIHPFSLNRLKILSRQVRQPYHRVRYNIQEEIETLSPEKPSLVCLLEDVAARGRNEEEQIAFIQHLNEKRTPNQQGIPFWEKRPDVVCLVTTLVNHYLLTKELCYGANLKGKEKTPTHSRAYAVTDTEEGNICGMVGGFRFLKGERTGQLDVFWRGILPNTQSSEVGTALMRKFYLDQQKRSG